MVDESQGHGGLDGEIRVAPLSASPAVMMRLDLSAPDYTTLSRRSRHLRRRLRPVPTGEGIHLVLDSTGLSIVGAGEWAAAKRGSDGEVEQRARQWISEWKK